MQPQIYIEDSTIPAIVKRLLDNPKYFAVSANVLNNPALSWVHYSMDVDIPYWPVWFHLSELLDVIADINNTGIDST